MQLNLDQELDRLVNDLPSIADQRRYWMIRTQGGTLYDSFREVGYVALEHDELPLSALSEYRKKAQDDEILLHNYIREHVRAVHEKLAVDHGEEIFLPRTSSLIASQIIKFIFDIKAGDIVIIPSYSSDIVSFGVVMESFIGNFSAEELRRMGDNYILKKRVKWLEDIRRIDLDPYLFRLFFGHQAVNEVSRYADIIERSLNNFFILDEEAHLILDIKTENAITAKDLFGLGYDVLQLVDEFAVFYGVKVSSNDLHVKVNLNSPGKIDLKSKIKKTTVVTGLILLVAGGGYKDKAGHSLESPGIPGIIRAIDEFLNHKQERELKQQMFNQYKDSLHVKDPADLIRLIKQVSDNKDLPK